jgi:hypothetical protein
MTIDEYQQAVNSHITDLLSNASINIRMNEDHVVGLLRDGRYKTQFESGTSGGVLSHAMRIRTEQLVFGYPEDTASADRPVYGYLAGKRDSSETWSYGRVVLRMRDDVRHRSTVVFADSLGDTSIGRWPTVAARWIDDADETVADYSRHDPLDFEDVGDVSPYAEVQIHGGVELSDIEEILFTLGAEPDSDLRRMLEDSGVKWRVIP